MMNYLLLLFSVILMSLVGLGNVSAAYDPSNKGGAVKTALTSITYDDGKHSVPLKFYMPKVKNAPTILLSHGLGGSREVGAYLAEHWASRGFLVIAMQHPGSDENVWKGVEEKDRFKILKKAANKQSFEQRNKDVVATLDYLNHWNKDPKHVLYQAVDLEKIAIGGHSFGAITSQAMVGQRYPLSGAKYVDGRLKAALFMSPTASKLVRNAKAFGSIQIPVMCMTGTKDKSMISLKTTAESRKKVYETLPATNNKYQLVLMDAEHMAFSDSTLRGDKQKNPNHHHVIIALSTAFFEAHLKQYKDAMLWLQSDAPMKILQKGDTWERK